MGGDALTCCARPDAENNNQNNHHNGGSRRSVHPQRASNECGSQVCAQLHLTMGIYCEGDKLRCYNITLTNA